MSVNEMGVESFQTDDYFQDSVEEQQALSGVADQDLGQEDETEVGEDEATTIEDGQAGQAENEVKDDKVENAFAKRLSKERAKLEAQYEPYKAIMENEAKKYGMTTEQYINAIQEEMQRQSREEAERVRAEEEERYSSLTPDEREAIKWAKENKSKVQQEQKWLSDAQALVEKFPDVKGVNDIPQEALDLYEKYNVPLVEAYDLIKNKLTKSRTEVEQEAIQNLKNNMKQNIGSLSSSTADKPTSIKDMSNNDFNKLVERVKRGEIKGF